MFKCCEAEDLGSVHWLSVDFKYPLAVPAWEGLGRCVAAGKECWKPEKGA